MYYQVLYLKDETYIDKYGIEQFEFHNEFAIVLFDKAKKPFAFIELNHSKFDSGLGRDIELLDVVNVLKNLGLNKLTKTKSANKLIDEIEKRKDICFKNIRTNEMYDYYYPNKDSFAKRQIYNLAIIDLKTKEELLFFENYYFNDENPEYKTIADGIMSYTMSYYNTKEYEEECRLEEEELQRQLQEEDKIKEQERIRAEATQLVREEEAKRLEELVNMKIKELEEKVGN